MENDWENKRWQFDLTFRSLFIMKYAGLILTDTYMKRSKRSPLALHTGQTSGGWSRAQR
jgi:hypothetical protein